MRYKSFIYAAMLAIIILSVSYFIGITHSGLVVEPIGLFMDIIVFGFLFFGVASFVLKKRISLGTAYIHYKPEDEFNSIFRIIIAIVFFVASAYWLYMIVNNSRPW